MTHPHRSQRVVGLVVALAVALAESVLPTGAAAAAGPFQVADLAVGPPFNGGQSVGGMLSLPSSTVFLTEALNPLPGGYPLRLEAGLWATDGTAAGTRLLRVWSTTEWDAQSRLVTVLGGRAILAPGGFSSWPTGFTVAGELLFFAADDGESGREPWAVQW